MIGFAIEEINSFHCDTIIRRFTCFSSQSSYFDFLTTEQKPKKIDHFLYLSIRLNQFSSFLVLRPTPAVPHNLTLAKSSSLYN